MSNPVRLLLLFGIGVVGLYFRIHSLNPESLYFGDEAAFIAGARALFGLPGWYGESQMAKPFFEMTLGWVISLSDNHLTLSQLTNAVIGFLWVPLCFGITRRLFANEGLAWLACGIAALDPWMIFYARKLNADAFSGFFWLLSCWFILARPSHRSTTFASGLFFGLSFTSNYRMLMFLPLIYLFICWQQNPWKEKSGRCLWHFVGVASAFVLVLKSYEALNGYNYLLQLLDQFAINTGKVVGATNFLTYPTLLVQFDSLPLAILMALGLAGVLTSGKREDPFKFLICFFVLPQAWFGMMHAAHARIWSPLLIWNAILAAYGLFSLSRLIQNERARKVGVFAMALLLFISLVPRAFSVKEIALPYGQAFSLLREREKRLDTPFISTDSLLHFSLVGHGNVGSIVEELGSGFLALQHQQEGYHYVLLDPYRFITPRRSILEKPRETSNYLETHCIPIASLACGSPKDFWSHFAWEHNHDRRATLHFLKKHDLESLPCLELYDLRTCPE